MSDVMGTLTQLGQAYMPDILEMIEQTMAGAVGQDSSLGRMTRYHMSTGGKRLRALLPLAVAQAMGEDPAALLAFGAACEMLHNATLVHDDLQDGDRLRRGQATVWVEYGQARAINLGDAMLYATMLLADRLPVDVARRHEAMVRIARETLRVVDGQEREFQLQEQDRPTREAYFAMVTGKTSGLFALPVAGAAALCGADDALMGALMEVTRHLGVIFQIQDDVLDIYGEKGRAHKGSDIGEGKISMLVVSALERADHEQATWLRALLRREREAISREDIARASALFVRSGALEEAFQEMDERAQVAANHPVLTKHPALAALLAGVTDVFLAPIAGVRERRLT